jgi:hypothetical protein
MRFFENIWVMNIIRLLKRIGMDNLGIATYSHRQKISNTTKIEWIYGGAYRKKIGNSKNNASEQEQDKYKLGIWV